VSDLDAQAFLSLLGEVRPVDVEAVLDRWLAGQSAGEAAQALVDAGLPPANGDAAAFVRTVAARPWADVVLAHIDECPLRSTADLAR
jgi:hypothetical protein